MLRLLRFNFKPQQMHEQITVHLCCNVFISVQNFGVARVRVHYRYIKYRRILKLYTEQSLYLAISQPSFCSLPVLNFLNVKVCKDLCIYHPFPGQAYKQKIRAFLCIEMWSWQQYYFPHN
jgi:hypothetical protein